MSVRFFRSQFDITYGFAIVAQKGNDYFIFTRRYTFKLKCPLFIGQGTIDVFCSTSPAKGNSCKFNYIPVGTVNDNSGYLSCNGGTCSPSHRELPKRWGKERDN